MKWRIFVTRRIPDAGIELLKENGMDVQVYGKEQAIPRKQLKEKIADCDALLCLLTESVDRDLLNSAPRLKIVANYAVGYNNIDLEACSERKVAVTNTPGVLTDATADLTFALILATAKRMIEADNLTRAGHFRGWGPLLLLGSDVSGQTLGIIGAGRIGSAVIMRASGFGMKILYYDRNRDSDLEKKYTAKFVNLEYLLQHSDFVSLHIPLNDQTYHLMNRTNINLMKKSAFLINSSRGPVIDEVALVEALKEGQIAGAGLDVYANEPDLAPGLSGLKNTVLLPHIASATVSTRTKMALMAAQNIIKMKQNKLPPNILNEEIFTTSTPK